MNKCTTTIVSYIRVQLQIYVYIKLSRSNFNIDTIFFQAQLNPQLTWAEFSFISNFALHSQLNMVA